MAADMAAIYEHSAGIRPRRGRQKAVPADNRTGEQNPGQQLLPHPNFRDTRATCRLLRARQRCVSGDRSLDSANRSLFSWR